LPLAGLPSWLRLSCWVKAAVAGFCQRWPRWVQPVEAMPSESK
jgi:hypothetical protein